MSDIQVQIAALRSEHTDPAEYMAALEALLQQQQVAFDQEATNLRAQASTSSAPVPVPVMVPTATTQFGRFQLAPFSGEEREDFRAWLKVAERKFATSNIADSERVTLAMDALRKEAQAWYVSEDDTEPFTDWLDFKSRFEAKYDTEMARERICRALGSLRFDGNYTKFITYFRTQSSRLRPGDKSLKDLIRDLTSPLPVEAQLFVYQREPKSVQDALAALERYDSLLKTVGTNKKKNGSSNLFSKVSADTGNGGVVPMEIDRLHLRTTQTDSKIGPCYNCNQMGHLAKQCPKKSNHFQSNKSRTNGHHGPGSRPGNGGSFHHRKNSHNRSPHLRQTEVEEDGETLSLRSVRIEDTDELRLSTSEVQEDIGHLVVYGLLRGEVLRFLLDTGANANFLSEAMAKFLELEPTGRKHRVRQAFTDGASTLGTVTTDLYLHQDRPLSTTFHVVPLKDYDGIIGIHFMRQHQAVPMWEQHTCAWGELGVAELHIQKMAVDTGSEEHQSLEQLLGSFDHLFSPPGFPPSRPWDHQIDTGDHRGIRQRDRPRSPLEHQAIRKFIDDGLASGTIIESPGSSWASPLHLVKKANGEYRPCVDYRQLNAVTQKNAYPLVRIDDCYQFLQGAKVFSTLDLKSGYWQVRMAEEDRHKTAFICRYGLYEFTVMPFGLCNAPATFQNMMNTVLAPLLDVCALVYLDDIVVYSADMASHLQHLRRVFELLAEHQLHLNREKCGFAQDQIKFLGHLVDAEGIKADPGKTKVVSEWPLPDTVTQLRSFVGSATYYKRFIKDYAKIASPLFSMMQGPKQQRLSWDRAAKQAFEHLKACLTSPGVLVHPRPGLRFILDTDASDIAVGGVLQQEDTPHELVSAAVKKSQLHPVAYDSRKLTETEQRYSAQEKELLAIRHCLEHFRGIIEGSPILVRTDHEPLKYLRTQKELGKRVRRFINDIEHFDPVIVYRPGHENIFADALSRRSGLPPSDGDEQPLFAAVTALRNRALPAAPAPAARKRRGESSAAASAEADHVPSSSSTSAPSAEAPASAPASAPAPERTSSTPSESVSVPAPVTSTTQPKLLEAAALLQKLRDGHTLPGYKLTDDGQGVVFAHPSHGLLTVPLGSSWLTEQLGKIHTELGHFGADVTAHGARQQIWINEDELAEHAQQVVAVCEECQLSARGGDRSAFAPLHMMPRPDFLQLWSFDFIGPLVKTARSHLYILTAIEHSTNFPLAVALPARSAEAAVLLLEQIVTFFGRPKQVLTDNGAEFTSYAFKIALARFGIKALHTSPYHPQTNGKVERFNSDLVNMLRKLVAGGESEDNWDRLLPSALLAYRAHPLSSHGKTPGFLMYGQDPVLPSRPAYEVLSAPPTDAEVRKIQDRRQEYAHDFDSLRRAAGDEHQRIRAQEVSRRNAAYIDQGFQVGDKVLRIKNERKHKLEPFWDGPFFIYDSSSSGSFQLQTTDGYLLRNLVPGEQLKLALDAEDRPLRWQLQNNTRRLRFRPRRPTPANERQTPRARPRGRRQNDAE